MAKAWSVSGLRDIVGDSTQSGTKGAVVEIEITKVLIQETILIVKEQGEKDLQKNKQHLSQLRITTLERSKPSVILQSAWEVLLSQAHGRNPMGRSSCVPYRGTFFHSMDLGHGTITKRLLSAFLCRTENEAIAYMHRTVMLPDILLVLVTFLLL